MPPAGWSAKVGPAAGAHVAMPFAVKGQCPAGGAPPGACTARRRPGQPLRPRDTDSCRCSKASWLSWPGGVEANGLYHRLLVSVVQAKGRDAGDVVGRRAVCATVRTHRLRRDWALPTRTAFARASHSSSLEHIPCRRILCAARGQRMARDATHFGDIRWDRLGTSQSRGLTVVKRSISVIGCGDDA